MKQVEINRLTEKWKCVLDINDANNNCVCMLLEPMEAPVKDKQMDL